MTKSVRANQAQDFKKINQKEQFVLKVSMYCALILAIFGIGFGIFVKSMAVIFDGFVALISVALGALSVLTSRYIYKEDDEIFQYGYGRFEPMVNLFKSLILVLVCAYALFDALHSLLKGGYKVAFGTIWFCSFWEFAWQKEFAFYIDPALLTLLSLVLIFTPLRIAIANFKDLIMLAPLELDEKITKIMENLSEEFGFSDYDTHVTKSGRFYMVEVNILMQKNFQVKSLNEFDLIRERIEKALEIPSYKIWLSVSFTADKKWL
ncbi:cation transporter [Campylobacter upsaliensis]|nr:cation transporter [Campylobacter upsaliensis]